MVESNITGEVQAIPDHGLLILDFSRHSPDGKGNRSDSPDRPPIEFPIHLTAEPFDSIPHRFCEVRSDIQGGGAPTAAVDGCNIRAPDQIMPLNLAGAISSRCPLSLDEFAGSFVRWVVGSRHIPQRQLS